MGYNEYQPVFHLKIHLKNDKNFLGIQSSNGKRHCHIKPLIYYCHLYWWLYPEIIDR